MKIPQQLLAVCAGSTDLHIRDTDSGTTALCEDRIIPVADGVVNPATALCVPCIGELERRRAARQQVRVLVSLRVAVIIRTCERRGSESNPGGCSHAGQWWFFVP